MERTLDADPVPLPDDPLVAPEPAAVSADAPGAAETAEPDQGWMLTAVLVGLIALLLLCAALALVAWDRAPVGAAG
jgi:hypothetical protein